MALGSWARGFPAVALALAAGGCATTAERPDIERTLQGSGTPVVVFQSGLGDGQGVWAPVQRRLPANLGSFAFSRPGYGGSAPHDGDHSPCRAATALRSALRDAGLRPPYLLVGHSLGGLYQFAFAKLFPDEVSGIVLVEPTHPRHWPRMQEDAPAMAAIVRAARLTLFSATMRREFDDQQRCLDGLAGLPAPRVPARVLVRGHFVPPEAGAFERLSRALWRDWSDWLAVKGVEPVEGAGHYIQRDRPAAVVEAILAVARGVP